MKKILFLLLATIAMHGQTYQNPTFGTVTTKTTPTVTTTPSLGTVESNGVNAKITPENLPISTATINALELKTENSAGAISGFGITNNGNGTVNIASGVALLRIANTPTATLIKFPIPAVTNLALTDNVNNYVLVDYNGGTPAITVTTSPGTINTTTNSLIYVISRVGNTLDYVPLVGQNVDSNAKLRRRFLNSEGLRRASGAVLTGSNRNLVVTAGLYYSGLIEVPTPAFNTSTTETFTQVYESGSTWVRTTGNTQINNTQYNNAGVLTNMPTNDYRVDYVYILANNPSKLYVILGNTTYANITNARLAPVPANLPSELQAIGTRIGRVIIQRLATTMEVSSEFATVYNAGSATLHNDLGGLNAGDFQHLTTAEKATVEYTTNKASTLTASSVLYPNNNAVIAGLAIKANDANVLHKTLDEAKNGLLKLTGFSNTIPGKGLENYFDSVANVSGINSVQRDGSLLVTDRYPLYMQASIFQLQYGNFGIDNASNTPLARIHVGNRSVNNSSDSQILISRDVDNSISGNGHAFSDSSNWSRNFTNNAYNSFDARINATGTGDRDHYAAFQSIFDYGVSGNLTDHYGYYSGGTVTNGKILNWYGAYLANPVKSGSGLVDNVYQIYIPNQTSGTLSNWSIFAEGKSNFGSLKIFNSLDLGSDASGAFDINYNNGKTGNIAFYGGGTTAKLLVDSDGNISATNYTGGATLTGTPTAPTAPLGTNTNQIATTAFVSENSLTLSGNQNVTGIKSLSTGSGSIVDAGISLDNNTSDINGMFRGRNDSTGRLLNFLNTSTGETAIIQEQGGGTGLRISAGFGGTTGTALILKSDFGHGTLKLLSVLENTTEKAYISDVGDFMAQKITANNVIKLKVYTVATLPAGTQGDTAFVTDALAPTYLTTVAGGGTVVCPVFYNGTNWVAH